jgi:hypothetical protein
MSQRCYQSVSNLLNSLTILLGILSHPAAQSSFKLMIVLSTSFSSISNITNEDNVLFSIEEVLVAYCVWHFTFTARFLPTFIKKLFALFAEINAVECVCNKPEDDSNTYLLLYIVLYVQHLIYSINTQIFKHRY